jgi:hypothetical protein
MSWRQIRKVSEFWKWRLPGFRVAQAIAAMPAEERARALEAAERSYCQTALDLGYGEAQAET